MNKIISIVFITKEQLLANGIVPDEDRGCQSCGE